MIHFLLFLLFAPKRSYVLSVDCHCIQLHIRLPGANFDTRSERERERDENNSTTHENELAYSGAARMELKSEKSSF